MLLWKEQKDGTAGSSGSTFPLGVVDEVVYYALTCRLASLLAGVRSLDPNRQLPIRCNAINLSSDLLPHKAWHFPRFLGSTQICARGACSLVMGDEEKRDYFESWRDQNDLVRRKN